MFARCAHPPLSKFVFELRKLQFVSQADLARVESGEVLSVRRAEYVENDRRIRIKANELMGFLMGRDPHGTDVKLYLMEYLDCVQNFLGKFKSE